MRRKRLARPDRRIASVLPRRRKAAKRASLRNPATSAQTLALSQRALLSAVAEQSEATSRRGLPKEAQDRSTQS